MYVCMYVCMYLRNGVHSAALGSGTAALRRTQGNTVALLRLLNTTLMVGIDVSARWLHGVQVGTHSGRSCMLGCTNQCCLFPAAVARGNYSLWLWRDFGVPPRSLQHFYSTARTIQQLFNTDNATPLQIMWV